MLDIKRLQKDPDAIRQALAHRHSPLNVDDFLTLDDERRRLIQETDALKAERNTASAEIGKRKRSGEPAEALMARMGEVNARIKELDVLLAEADAKVEAWMLACPNAPHASTPVGASEADNPVVHVWGEKPAYDFAPKEHWELGATLGGLDFERAAKISGARFAVSWGWAARLERALAAFMLDVHTQENGYTEVATPVIVTAKTLYGTGQLPKFAEDLFKLEGTDQHLIPTAEVPVTNLHADETLPEESLPRAYCAHTPCFRSEAGSAGKDTRGLIRLHQFNKVELVRLCRPEDSYAELETLRRHAESILQKLGLHYRVIELCTGDIGFSSAKTYDLEVWLPGQNAYREISSCSNCEDFQARRAGIRCKSKADKKSRLVHTLNGSGLAVGRTLVAVLENGQRADGSVVIPEALVPYMGGLRVITPA
ncbi:serine--tRNA ligase [Megalodesulfovibrio gigas]|uniref:Serine--tRNA ligase n=1 Tax=Megalodesulfovibrio gigas (strain ATCC 19364 / DSM 1382 / NCIMB 9332 / VKM B-1759) TaxID=1121448 RepID=T2G7S1_MEGG1|nr:serine--tRNA ligase [Megalodesulfovibrio gigas]AGW12338.1 putative seryl-tRNA synthetase [Megalodesulfovibrio gigas DSM 1382 = ATCC 19364]